MTSQNIQGGFFVGRGEKLRFYEGHDAELYYNGLNHYVFGVLYRMCIDKLVLESTREYNSHLLLVLGIAT